MVKFEGEEYRIWNLMRLKFGVVIFNGFKNFLIKLGLMVFYFGVVSGIIVFYVSDIVGWEGKVFGVEFLLRVFREFVLFVEERRNIVLIFGDVIKFEGYCVFVLKVDVIFEDVV